jgi:hypothetical protein
LLQDAITASAMKLERKQQYSTLLKLGEEGLRVLLCQEVVWKAFCE